MKKLVHTAVQTLESNELHQHTLSDKIDLIIETNTKSIVDVIARGQMANYNKIFSNQNAQSQTWLNGVQTQLVKTNSELIQTAG